MSLLKCPDCGKLVSSTFPFHECNSGEITISKLDREERCGDWHDKPVRYAVNGPRSECQKFSTKKDAQKYASVRRRHSDQLLAIKAYLAA